MEKRILMIAMLSTLLAACGVRWTPAFDEAFPAADEGRIDIAPLDEALTFARIEDGGVLRVVAVTAWEGGTVAAVDLGAPGSDPVAVFAERGYDAIATEVRSAPPSARLAVPSSSLRLPVDFGPRNIAVGTNYPEHASDAGTTRPFLFPKVVEPGVSGDDVSAGPGLLDYEVEVAVVPLAPLGRDALPTFLGVLLANDFTDRETLMHAVDRNDVESGKGFTTGKSFPGYLPVGGLFVVPRDWRAFVPQLELRLFVNGRLRQRSRASEMVWDVEEVLRQSWARHGVTWEHRGAEVALFDGDAIPERTLVLTGTPHGTVFDGVPPAVMAAGLARWILGGWDRSVPGQVIQAYVDAARDARAYLQPGDDVRIHVHRLGEIRSRVVP